MRATSKLLALALTAALQPAVAGVVPLTFEDFKATEDNDGLLKLTDQYIKDGIVFSGAAWAQVHSPYPGSDPVCGSDGVAKFVPHDGGCVALALNGGGSFRLNFAPGFISGTSMFYSALEGAGVKIRLYEGENGTGNSTLLQGLGLTEANCTTVRGARFCNWDLLTLTFDGIARSMDVSATDQSLMLDDFSFVQSGTTTPPGRLPEPASLVLAFSALGALGWARKRAAR
ncbi:hypothetical protein [Roseateles sp. P5_E7]